MKLTPYPESLRLGVLDRFVILHKLNYPGYHDLALEYNTMVKTSDAKLNNLIRILREGEKPKPRDYEAMRREYTESMEKLNQKINKVLKGVQGS